MKRVQEQKSGRYFDRDDAHKWADQIETMIWIALGLGVFAAAPVFADIMQRFF